MMILGEIMPEDKSKQSDSTYNSSDKTKEENTKKFDLEKFNKVKDKIAKEVAEELELERELAF